MAPSIRVNGGTAGLKAAVSASTSVTATLDSTDGVRQTAWTVYSTDETSETGDYALVQSGSVGQTVTFTSLTEGTALILQAVINAGIDQATGLASVTATRARVKVHVPLPDGGEVGCVGEEFESDPVFGSTGIINAGIRKAALLSPSGVAVKIVRAATATALPANTRTSNTITADANGALGSVGGVSVSVGDYVLVKDEGGGSSHVNNGAYRVVSTGSVSTKWSMTRATYFDESSELIAMTTFRIQEGTYAGKEFYLVTSGATINSTALEFAAFGYAPNDAAYLCVGSSGFLSNEVNISAIGSTVSFVSTTTIPVSISRTASATAELIDVAYLIGLSSGSAAAGFGPALLVQGEVSGGGAENYGRIGWAATDLTGSSEDTKAVLQCRTAGAALATCAEFSGTGSTLYREDSSTDTTLAMLDLRRTSSGTAANGIGGSVTWTLEDSAGNADVAGSLAVDYLDATSASEDARFLFRGMVGGSLTDLFSLRGTTVRIPGLAGGGTGIVGFDNNGDLTVGTAAPADATYLVTSTNSTLSNEVVIGSLGSTLTFGSTTVQPIRVTWDDSSTDSTLTVAALRRTSSGTAANGIGAALIYELEDGSAGIDTAGSMAVDYTDVTSLSQDARWLLRLRVNGDLTDVLSMRGTTMRIHGLAGNGTGVLAIDNNGDVSFSAGGGASSTANYITDSASTVNANDRPAQALPATLEFIRAGGAAIGATHTAAAGSVQTAAYIRRAITGGTSANTGTGVAVEWTIPDGQLTPAVVTVAKERAEWTSLLAGTGTSKIVWSTVNSGSLTDWMTLAGNGNLRLHAYTTAGMLLNDASGNVSSANPALLVNGTFSGVSNAIDITGLASTIYFTSTSTTPLGARRADASTNDVQTVLIVDRLTGGTAANGIGGGALFNVQDDGGDLVEAGRLDVVLTDVTAAAHDAEWRFLAAAAGSLTQAAAITAAGFVTATAGFVGNSIDRATAGTLTIGGTATSVVVTPNATFDGTITENRPAIGTTITIGILGTNVEPATVGTPVQLGPAVASRGTGYSSGGATSTTITTGFYTRPLSAGTAGSEMVFFYSTGVGAEFGRWTTSLPSLGGSGLAMGTTILLATTSNGFRLDQGSSNIGGVKTSSSDVVLESQGSTKKVQIWSALGTSDSGDGVRVWNNAGTRTNGNLIAAGDGGSYTQKWAVQYDGATITPRTVSAASAPTSSSNAVTFNLSTSQNVEHAISENTTVTITGGSRGQRGVLVFTQDGVGRTITMPSASSTIVYDSVLAGLGVTAMVDTTAAAVTILQYYITGADKVLIFGRAVLPT